MIGRRGAMKALAVGAVISFAQGVSACSFAEYQDDDWGNLLIRFFKTGNDQLLAEALQDFSTLVSFSPVFLGNDVLQFSGASSVLKALKTFRESLTTKGWVGPRQFISAKIVGSSQQGRMNRIELLFAESVVSDTSCGPDRSETRVDLYYEAGVYGAGQSEGRWAIERLAILPPLETEKY